MGMNRGQDLSGGGAIRGALRRGQEARAAQGTGGLADRFRQAQQTQGRMMQPTAPPPRGNMAGVMNQPYRPSGYGGSIPGRTGGVVGPQQAGLGGRMAQQQQLAQQMRRPPNPGGGRAPMTGRYDRPGRGPQRMGGGGRRY